jgi:chromosome segregation ATPase
MQQMEERIAARLQARELDLEAISQKVAEKLMARLDESIAGFHARITEVERAAANAARALEKSVESLRQQLNDVHAQMAASLHEFELNLKAQANALESARTSMAQTDDRVERVVEALESLQSTVLEQSEERALALN